VGVRGSGPGAQGVNRLLLPGCGKQLDPSFFCSERGARTYRGALIKVMYRVNPRRSSQRRAGRRRSVSGPRAENVTKRDRWQNAVVRMIRIGHGG